MAGNQPTLADLLAQGPYGSVSMVGADTNPSAPASNNNAFAAGVEQLKSAFVQAMQLQDSSSANPGDSVTIPLWRTAFHAPTPMAAVQSQIHGRPEFTSSGGQPQYDPKTGKPITRGDVHDYATIIHEGQDITQQYTEKDAILQFGKIVTDPKLLAQWTKTAINAGYITPDKATDVTALADAWAKAVALAKSIKIASNGKVEYTPFEAADHWAEVSGSKILAQQAYAAYHFTGTRVDDRQTTVDTTPLPNGYTLLSNALQRGASDKEYAAFQAGWAAANQANPVVQTTSGTYADGVLKSKEIDRTGGVDQSKVAQDLIDQNPEVGMIQRATTYMDALRTALAAAF